MKKTSSWLWGCVLIALGVILGVNALGVAHINIFFPGWWTLFIIVPCGIALFTDEHKSGAVAGLVVGICLLLSCLGVLPFGILWKLLLPAILIIIGVSVMVRGTANGRVADEIREAREEQKRERRQAHKITEAEIVEDETKSKTHNEDHEDIEDDESDNSQKVEEYWSTFGDQQIDYSDKDFKGCRVDAVFGGADIDLRKAKIKNKSILRTSSIFGGIIVYVPDDVKVEVASTSIFGGVTDKRSKYAGKHRRQDQDEETQQFNKTLYIDANCVFGGLEIR